MRPMWFKGALGSTMSIPTYAKSIIVKEFAEQRSECQNWKQQSNGSRWKTQDNSETNEVTWINERS
jgi:hypothetical protein